MMCRSPNRTVDACRDGGYRCPHKSALPLIQGGRSSFGAIIMMGHNCLPAGAPDQRLMAIGRWNTLRRVVEHEGVSPQCIARRPGRDGCRLDPMLCCRLACGVDADRQVHDDSSRCTRAAIDLVWRHPVCAGDGPDVRLGWAVSPAAHLSVRRRIANRSGVVHWRLPDEPDLAHRGRSRLHRTTDSSVDRLPRRGSCAGARLVQRDAARVTLAACADRRNGRGSQCDRRRLAHAGPRSPQRGRLLRNNR